MSIENIYLEQKCAHFPRTGDAVGPLCTNISNGGVDGKQQMHQKDAQNAKAYSKSVTGGVVSIVKVVRPFYNEVREHCTQVRRHFD